MSAMPTENHHDAQTDGRPEGRSEDREDEREQAPAPGRDATPVVVRRNLAWSIPVALLASAVGIAYLARAADSGAALDWALCAVSALVAGFHLVGLVDARTPLLVADELGVRIRLGRQWRGLPWDAVQEVLVEPRRGRLRDGRLLVLPHSLGRALDGLDVRARHQASVNQKRYGAALAVPLGLVTRVSSAGEKDLAERIATLSEGRSGPVTLLEGSEEPLAEQVAPEHADHPEARRSLAVGLGSIVSRVAKGRSHDIDQHPENASEPAVPVRETRRSVRAEITSTAAEAENDVDEARGLAGERRLSRPGSVDLVYETPESNVRPISTMGDVVEPLVIDDFETQPAYDPVIGPELVAARHRVGLSVDELAERTRIRPHVIESIEVDDFAPCGGDVYARGHIRTLARVLGKDPAPLLAAFDNRYTNAPISARRVFEAELATGMTGSMRSTVGGPNWNLLLGFVLTLVLVWGVVRLFSGAPNEMVENPPPLPAASQWPPRAYDAPKHPSGTVPKRTLRLEAVNASTRVQVTDRDGTVVFDQRLVLGETTTLKVPSRVTVSADDGGAVNVTWGKQDQGLLGEADRPAELEFGPSAG